ncbi:MAG: hypothetical protein KKG33_00510 [candidate division Zixibacteria bacterium]|nr:hypothetical protein [candidate division Zixibacteria bacterium]MBU1469873.1 hypothetical protein [candidate division Zixibacteria bacterium]MBU2624021.1 hypothetical protein [candidate division Zixibacteria bacterium]
MNSVTRIESNGLCRTCNNESICVYRLKRGYDALYCDMFDDYVKPGSNGNGHHDSDAVVAAEPAQLSELKGLCANCDHKDRCTLPKPEGGVWHCEEYC